MNLLLIALCVCVVTLSWSLFSQAEVNEDALSRQRENMVREQIEARDIKDRHILNAMRTVKRHLFVPKGLINRAYLDSALPIGEKQTISQPYIVAIMTYLLEPHKDDVVLEIGAGSGYQAAVLAELVKEVYTIEIIETLGKRAQKLLNDRLGYTNIHVRIGDGYQGWPEHAPFDAIIVTAAPDHIPKPLVEQLKIGGRMVIPVGKDDQKLMLIQKTSDEVVERTLIPVRFVPMTGEAQRH
ncbi:protein-L-isoaspartate(D-aspartate) O-methyltransferase [bacterium]|nr:protein-L-isoaspartate(D-aspartate) O-methyltransferase [bacterium]